LDPKQWPALDQIAPTDTPEVQQWIQEVQATGVNIPNFNATVDGRLDIFFFLSVTKFSHRQAVVLPISMRFRTPAAAGGLVVAALVTLILPSALMLRPGV